jgi:hypothetical protein
LVVTPSRRPVAESSLISATSAVSTKNFMLALQFCETTQPGPVYAAKGNVGVACALGNALCSPSVPA